MFIDWEIQYLKVSILSFDLQMKGKKKFQLKKKKNFSSHPPDLDNLIPKLTWE